MIQLNFRFFIVLINFGWWLFQLDNNYRPSIANAEENILPGPATTENHHPVSDDDAEKTGSPFDFLNDVLDEEHDLNNAKAALDSPNTRDVINQNGKLTNNNDEIFVFFNK